MNIFIRLNWIRERNTHRVSTSGKKNEKEKIAQVENETRRYMRRINEVDFDYSLLLIFDQSYF